MGCRLTGGALRCPWSNAMKTVYANSGAIMAVAWFAVGPRIIPDWLIIKAYI